MIRTDSIEKSEKVPPSPLVNEKQAVTSETASVVDSVDGDEALHLVGRERTSQFSEEYNKRLRRKLVRFTQASSDSGMVLKIAPGLRDPSTLCSCVLHAVLVRSYVYLAFARFLSLVAQGQDFAELC